MVITPVAASTANALNNTPLKTELALKLKPFNNALPSGVAKPTEG